MPPGGLLAGGTGGKRRRRTHAGERNAEAGAVEPAETGVEGWERVDCGAGGEGAGVGVEAVVGQDEFREGARGEDEGHDEGKVEPHPNDVRHIVATDGVGVDVVIVYLEIDHVEGKGLDEAKHGFAKEGVDTKRCLVLVKQRHD